MCRRGIYRRYDAWAAAIPATVAADFGRVVAVVDDWRPQVMAYFDVRVTNGATEALHKRIRMISRVGQGLDFTMVRAKAVYGPPLGPTTTLREAYRRGRDRGRATG